MTFAYIWYNALFTDDYLELLPEDPKERYKVEVANIWRGVYSAIAFMLAFSFLKPYPENELGRTQ